jgi:3-methyladenine DNA glycosylase/8-oxoguanine DNA glycosylase
VVEQVLAPATPGWDVRGAARVVKYGRHDPCALVGTDGLWWAALTPDGPGTLRLRWRPGLDADAWGDGAQWMLARVPGLVGALDDPSALVTDHPLVSALQQRHPHHRIGRTDELLSAGVQAILGQRVTTIEARQSWAEIVRTYGEAAPGPTIGADARPSWLRVPPTAERLAGLPGWAFHRFGVERKRADTIRRYCAELPRLHRDCDHDRSDGGEQFHRRFRSITGLGIWSEAETKVVALGDPDALQVGDYHACHIVTHAFTGAWRGTDELMVELLAPFAGQRRRVVALLGAAGLGPERRAPRQRINPIARW